eukprot:COSAG02_NODE_418_length_22698_cov_7.471127_7_plen_110_part_00
MFLSVCRPWIPFHCDSARVTCNVSLCSEKELSGGELLVLTGGQVISIVVRNKTIFRRRMLAPERVCQNADNSLGCESTCSERRVRRQCTQARCSTAYRALLMMEEYGTR